MKVMSVGGINDLAGGSVLMPLPANLCPRPELRAPSLFFD